jgi:hypothetical protein
VRADRGECETRRAIVAVGEGTKTSADMGEEVRSLGRVFALSIIRILFRLSAPNEANAEVGCGRIAVKESGYAGSRLRGRREGEITGARELRKLYFS